MSMNEEKIDVIEAKPAIQPEKVVEDILKDASHQPREFVESWEVPGGAE